MEGIDKMKLEHSLKVLDLFAGAGGLAQGFKSAGFETVAGVDIDKSSMGTFSKNFPESKIFCEDLSKPSKDFLGFLKTCPKIDVIVGGPPCQGFSVAGKRLIDDPRNSLYRHYLKIVKIVKPTYVVIENVPTIRTMGEGKVSKAIVKDLNKLGYEVRIETVNASDFGVPQNRIRTFFIAKYHGDPVDFPRREIVTKKITTKEAIGDLPILKKHFTDIPIQYSIKPKNDYQREMRKDSIKINNHWAVNHSEQTKSIIALVPDGGNYKDLPQELQKIRNVNIAWTRMNSKKPSFTIDTGHNHHFHYKANRVPTVRECARIQSFPDSFIFLGTKTSQLRQVGNAVPPLLAAALAREIFKDLLCH
jgi:DNA (cytosine-5)-methyltransferase 1